MPNSWFQIIYLKILRLQVIFHGVDGRFVYQWTPSKKMFVAKDDSALPASDHSQTFALTGNTCSVVLEVYLSVPYTSYLVAKTMYDS